MLKRVLKYIFLFTVLAGGAQYYQTQVLPNQNYQKPKQAIQTKQSNSVLENIPTNEQVADNQQQQTPTLQADQKDDHATKLPIPQHTPVPLEGYRWPTKNITVSINSNDPAVVKAFTDAINNWNKTQTVNLKIVNNDQNPNIVCGTQDLSKNTVTTPNSTTKELGLTQCQYDPTTNQIHHATSNIDNNTLASSTDDYRTKVAMHELGHAIGLNHAPQHSDSIMVPYNVGSDITPSDITSVKALYQE